ncbi:MAG: 50S ribosomal protein L9 [Thermomicrobiales bacterium]
MKIVLRQDVPKLGESGSIQTVANGYARNFLIPQGFAVVATDAEIKVATHNLAVKERKVLRQEEQQQSFADKIAGTRLVFTAKASDQGRLFGSVTAADVARELSAKVGEEVDRRRVQLEDPLRSIGEHTVSVHIVGRLRPQIIVVIEGEHVEEAAAESTEETQTDETAEATAEA